MTKYGHYLAALDRDCPATYRGKFLAYKRLKKCLKQCQAAAAAAGNDSGSPGDSASSTGTAAAGQGLPEAEAELERCQLLFFELLSTELAKANSCFVATAQAIVSRYQRAELRRRLACCLPALLLAAGPAAFADLAERAYWCRKYARANAVALRKILKKYDKLCGGQRGRSFLQHCWQLPAGGAFLHSPLLDELKAIQDILHEPRMQQPEDSALCEVADTSAKAGRRAAAAAAVAGTAGGHTRDPAAPAPAPIRVPCSAAGCPAAGSPSSACSEPAALGAVVDSPTCMLSSSDSEWAAEEGCGGSSCLPSAAAGAAPPASAAAAVALPAQRPSSCSALSSVPASASSACLSPATSPRSTGGGSKLLQLLRGQAQAASAAAGKDAGEAGSSASAAGGPAQAASAGAAAAAAAQGGDAAQPGTPPLKRQSASRFRDEDLRCPICLDVLYKPVGLACGHKFCKECALSNAGLGRAIGTFANLASYVSSRAACPQCRQPRVYRGAMRLRQLDRVVRARFPQDWEQRRREEQDAKSSAVEAAAAPARRSWMHTINARDALLGL
ncbi:hypothetical protein ABPG75_000148 [Micractinium tetrahymenae]